MGPRRSRLLIAGGAVALAVVVRQASSGPPRDPAREVMLEARRARIRAARVTLALQKQAR
jgi:hypothetical protein